MGLGLSLAKEIVDSLGGTIRVSSKLAEGSTFTVWIPEGKG
jgi:signal transduction histidine kinase